MLYWTKSPFNLMCSAIITSLFCSGEDQWTGSYETFSIYLTIAFWANCNLSVMDFPGSQHSCTTRKHSCLCFPAGTRGLRSSPLVGWGTAGLSVTISLSAGVKLKVLPAGMLIQGESLNLFSLTVWRFWAVTHSERGALCPDPCSQGSQTQRQGFQAALQHRCPTGLVRTGQKRVLFPTEPSHHKEMCIINYHIKR